MRSMIDTHLHLWDPTNLDYPWLSGLPALDQPFLLKEYDAARGDRDIGAMVFVECTGSMTDQASRAEVEWVESLAVGDARIRGIVAHASLEHDIAVAPHLTWLASRPLVRGVRRLIQSEPDPGFCLQPGFLRSLRSLPSFGLSFDICVYHNQLPSVLKMVEACPEVSFILDHVGKPGIRDGALDPWREHLSALARWPNVVCKLSGLITEADPETWTATDVLPVMRHALEVFGPDRLMFGSDWPVVNLAGSLGRWLDVLDQFDRFLDARDRQAIYYDNAVRAYRLDARP